jgi:hypothetical protein
MTFLVPFEQKWIDFSTRILIHKSLLNVDKRLVERHTISPFQLECAVPCYSAFEQIVTYIDAMDPGDLCGGLLAAIDQDDTLICRQTLDKTGRTRLNKLTIASIAELHDCLIKKQLPMVNYSMTARRRIYHLECNVDTPGSLSAIAREVAVATGGKILLHIDYNISFSSPRSSADCWSPKFHHILAMARAGRLDIKNKIVALFDDNPAENSAELFGSTIEALQEEFNCTVFVIPIGSYVLTQQQHETLDDIALNLCESHQLRPNAL